MPTDKEVAAAAFWLIGRHRLLIEIRGHDPVSIERAKRIARGVLEAAENMRPRVCLWPPPKREAEHIE